MKTRPLAIALLLALAPATFPVTVYAQAPADDATTTMARARFKEGVEFYDKGDFEQARASFLQAYALKKHPAVLLNLAWSCVKSGHALEGERYFKQFLSEGKEITDKQRADATDGLTQARNKLGHIEIQATAGSEVTVDGEKVGTAPLADTVSVEAGAHTVKFKGPDGTTDTQSVTVLGGEKQVAKFGKPGGAVAPSPTPEKTEPTPASPPEQPKPEEPKPEEPAPVQETPASSGGSIFSRPASIAPPIVLWSIGGASFIVAAFLVPSKSSAQSNANTAALAIEHAGGGANTCTPAGLGAAPQFGQACNAYSEDLKQVNQDATAANVLVGVGVAAVVGGFAWWLFAPKANAQASTGALHVTTDVGRSYAGVNLGAAF
ncbi:MAG TPA: PEGA domain-containing protein [Polyangiaceae bacterium]